MARPIPIDYAPYYGKYVVLVPEDDIVAALRSELNKTLAFLHSVAEGESIVRHPPYTWSVKEVVGHLMDCERVFGYRALRFARGDSTPLPGFDENAYACVAQFDRFPLQELTAEFESVSDSTSTFLETLPPMPGNDEGLPTKTRFPFVPLRIFWSVTNGTTPTS